MCMSKPANTKRKTAKDYGLTDKQFAFCQEYLVDMNATQAAIRAGYSEKTAHVIGHENLTKPKIQECLQELMSKRAERVELTADRVLAEIQKNAFANMLDYVTVQKNGLAYIDLSELTREQAAAISEVTIDEYKEGRGEDSVDVLKTRIKLNDKVKSLEQLGRHLGLFLDRRELSGPGGGPIELKRSPEDYSDEELAAIVEDDGDDDSQ